MKQVDPKISQYFSELSKKRKHPHMPFVDKEFAKKASTKGVAARVRKKRKSNSEKKKS